MDYDKITAEPSRARERRFAASGLMLSLLVVVQARAAPDGGAPKGSAPAAEQAPHTAAGAGWACLPPDNTTVRCPKAAGADDLDDLLAGRHTPPCDERRERRRRLRFRVGMGPWMELAATRWRCVPLPTGGKDVPIAIGDETDRISIPSTCESRRVDAWLNPLYGTMRMRCSKRPAKDDDLVADYLIAPPAKK